VTATLEPIDACPADHVAKLQQLRHVANRYGKLGVHSMPRVSQ
jgi:hypothetical protein